MGTTSTRRSLRSPRTLRTPLIAFALASVLALVSCSSDAGQTSAAETSAAPSPAAVSSGPWAMTGEARPPGQEDATVLAVKIENTEDGQVAVDQADLVTQLPVEGGLTRLAAFYESVTPDRVGPVRSARNSDIGLVQPADAVLVASGGASSTLTDLESAGVTLVDENSPGMTRDPNRPASNNVFADLPEIRRNHEDQIPQQPYLNFGPFLGTGGQPAKDVQITFSEVSNEGWTFRSETDTWRRQALGAYEADTLLVFTVNLGDAGYQDAAGSPVPIVLSTGQGPGWIATGGKTYEVTWSKVGDEAPWRITSKTGELLQVPPGKSWISLIPATTGRFASS